VAGLTGTVVCLLAAPPVQLPGNPGYGWLHKSAAVPLSQQK